MTEEKNSKTKENYGNVKEEFKKLIQDFIKDLLITFPELTDRLDKTLLNDDCLDEAFFNYYTHISYYPMIMSEN